MLILASASPRRRELLTQAGLTFQVEPANIPEDLLAGEEAANYVSRLAEEKATVVFEKHRTKSGSTEPGSVVVLGADTCVLLDGRIFGKPANRAEARSMLECLSGRTHQVLTGVAVVTHAGATVAVEVSQVTFDLISPEEIEHYLSTGEPLDKAGAYGIQGYAARWIPRIEGCYFNVVGLPVARTINLLAMATDSGGKGLL